MRFLTVLVDRLGAHAGPEHARRHDLLELAVLRLGENLQLLEIVDRLDRFVALASRLRGSARPASSLDLGATLSLVA